MAGLLLDTHVWWWTISEPQKLSQGAIEALVDAEDEEIAIAFISLWEFAMMVSRDKISLSIDPAEWMRYSLYQIGVRAIPLDERIAIESCGLPGNFHKDPADRIIVATARIYDMKLLTKDEKILDYPGVATIW